MECVIIVDNSFINEVLKDFALLQRISQLFIILGATENKLCFFLIHLFNIFSLIAVQLSMRTIEIIANRSIGILLFCMSVAFNKKQKVLCK